jgi:hypothetical protein
MPEGVGKGKGKVCFESMHLRHFTEAGGIAYGGHLLRHYPWHSINSLCIRRMALSPSRAYPLAAAKARGQVLGAYAKDDKTKFVGRTGTREDCLKAAAGKKDKADQSAQHIRQFIEDCGVSPEASAKAIARFLTERGVQTPSGRSTTWQATTVQRLKSRWGDSA